MDTVNIEGSLGNLHARYPFGFGDGLDDSLGSIVDMDNYALTHPLIGGAAVADY